jgi:hypothetical protein
MKETEEYLKKMLAVWEFKPCRLLICRLSSLASSMVFIEDTLPL